MAVTSRALKGIKKDRKIDNAEGAPVTCLAVPTTCSELLDELERTRAACITRGLVPVFHYTSPVVFRMTITSGFRMSALFVYGAKPSVLQQVPKNNANMVSKRTFEALSLSNSDGCYYLRPDRILCCFLPDRAKPPLGYAEV